jgi:phosphate transport system permease protein
MKDRYTVAARHKRGRIMAIAFLGSTVFAVLCLAVLIASIVNQTAGYVLLEYANPPEWVLPSRDGGDPTGDLETTASLDSLDAESLLAVLDANLSSRRRKALEIERGLATRSREELSSLVVAELLEPEVEKTWTLLESVFAKDRVIQWIEENEISGDLSFRWWISGSFLASAQSSNALFAGVRSAVIGSLMTILLTVLVAFPIALGAAIYLEEYARDNLVNRIIKTNIYNLAGVPSIIYGMLGLGIFVRVLSPMTSGALFGVTGENSAGDGRTVLSAAFTLALLLLPTIIINAQEAIRAVPRTLRESGYALGATKWQVTAHHVLPASMDRILTGTVLAVSRGIGETAPLVLVGAATFLTKDPTGPFSRFTTLPIQIYQWTARPQAEFRNIAAAAIVILLVLSLSINAVAITVRNRLRANKRG